MMIESKVGIYKMYIRPILTYAAKTSTEISKTKKKKRILKTVNEKKNRK